MKSRIIELLTTTNLSHQEVANKVECSIKYVRAIDTELSKNKKR